MLAALQTRTIDRLRFVAGGGASRSVVRVMSLLREAVARGREPQSEFERLRI